MQPALGLPNFPSKAIGMKSRRQPISRFVTTIYLPETLLKKLEPAKYLFRRKEPDSLAVLLHGDSHLGKHLLPSVAD